MINPEFQRKETKTADQYRYLSLASSVLSMSLEKEVIVRNVARVIIPRLASGVFVDYFDDEGKETNFKSVLPKYFKDEDISQIYQTHIKDAGHVRQAVLTKRTLRFDNIAETKTCWMIVPVHYITECLGSITYVSANGEAFDDSDLEIAEDLASRFALAFKNASLYEKVESANRSKDEFLRILSHELRTPAGIVVGWAELLLEDHLDPRATHEAYHSIYKSAKTQLGLINDLLDVTRIVTGKLSLELETTELTPIVYGSLDLLKLMASGKDITLNVNLNSTVLIKGDGNRLKQVFTNILGNAIKFTPQGGVINVDAEVSDGYVKLSVQDNGEGISKQFIHQVFERFSQSDCKTTRRSGGLGLGLAICKYIVESHGGQIFAESAGIGKGATFTVSLPLKK